MDLSIQKQKGDWFVIGARGIVDLVPDDPLGGFLNTETCSSKSGGVTVALSCILHAPDVRAVR